MKKAIKIDYDPEMPDEIDFNSSHARRTGVRGKYAKGNIVGNNVVTIEPDLTDLFPNSESVNQALRALAKVIRAAPLQTKSRRKMATQKAK